MGAMSDLPDQRIEPITRNSYPITRTREQRTIVYDPTRSVCSARGYSATAVCRVILMSLLRTLFGLDGTWWLTSTKFAMKWVLLLERH